MGEVDETRGVERPGGDSERIKAILKLLEESEKVTEGDVVRLLGVDKDTAGKYVKYLSDKGYIEVKTRVFREPELVLKQKSPEAVSEVRKEVKVEVAESAGGQQPETPATATPAPKPEETPEEPKPQEKPEKPVEGEKFIPETEEDFYKICKNLTTDFIGLIRLLCEVDGQSYSAGLLIHTGDIVAATFEHLDEARIYYGDEAMQQIKDKFVGTKGDLEIYALTEESLESALDEEEAVLAQPIRLSTLKLKIRSRMTEAAGEEAKPSVFKEVGSIFGGGGDVERKSMRLEGIRQQRFGRIERLGLGKKFSLVDFARNLSKLDPLKAKRFEELRKRREAVGAPEGEGVGAGSGDLKSRRLEELKSQRSGRLKLSDVLNKFKPQAGLGQAKRVRPTTDQAAEKTEVGSEGEGKRPVKKVSEGVRVETKIDRLFELVEKHGKIKINDALTGRLKVSKTQVEEWAMILEEHDLVELKYPTIGEPEIYKKKHEKGDEKDGGGKQS